MSKSLNPAQAEQLTATAARRAISAGSLRCVELMEACLAQIDAREDAVKAWVSVDRDAALEHARAADKASDTAALRGIPIGFKDIIDTAAFATSYGSPIYAGYRPRADAACVSLTRQAGAVALGKTVTTEFAVRHPNKTRNPHHPDHTPGGSSSGSAAAVAAGMVPLAFGTQTAGSVIRPAAYCGIVGYKPTIGQFSYVGVKLLARSLDTLGAMARCVDDLALLRGVLMAAKTTLPTRARAPRIGVYRTPWWSQVQASSQQRIDDAVAQLRNAGAQIVDVDVGPAFEPLNEANGTIMAYEGCRSLAYEIEHHEAQISPVLRDIMLPARSMPYGEYAEALMVATAAKEAFQDCVLEFDAILTPSAPGEAPKGLESTGDPLFNKAWTTIGAPCITLPVGTGPAGLPLGVQLVASVGADLDLLTTAKWVEQHLR